MIRKHNYREKKKKKVMKEEKKSSCMSQPSKIQILYISEAVGGTETWSLYVAWGRVRLDSNGVKWM